MAAISHVAAPLGWRGPVWVCVGPHCAGSASSPQKIRQVHTSQPPRDGEIPHWSAWDPTALAPQQTSKEAT
eukprot:5281214-Pyramimonas_sp.AAC.1